MKIYNTMSRQLEVFQPIEAGSRMHTGNQLVIELYSYRLLTKGGGSFF